MAYTLAEGNKHSTTILQAATIDYLRKADPILERLKWKEIIGNSLTYNVVATRPTAGFYDVGDTWTESTHTVTANTVTLKILGGDADVDAFLKRTRSNIQDLEGEILEQKTLAVRETFLDRFFYGDSTTEAKAFDGLHKLMTSTTYNTVHAGSGTGTALSMLKLDQAIDLIKPPFRPTLIVSSKEVRRRVGVYLNSIGSAFPASRDQFGIPVKEYAGIPWSVSDYIVDTETAASGAYGAKTGGANSTIWILTFHPQGVCGAHAGNLTVDKLGKLETKDAERFRIKWYVGLMFQDLSAAAKVDGIIAAGTVTA